MCTMYDQHVCSTNPLGSSREPNPWPNLLIRNVTDQINLGYGSFCRYLGTQVLVWYLPGIIGSSSSMSIEKAERPEPPIR